MESELKAAHGKHDGSNKYQTLSEAWSWLKLTALVSGALVHILYAALLRFIQLCKMSESLKMLEMCPPFVLIGIRVWHKQQNSQSRPEWLNVRVYCYYLPTLWWRGHKKFSLDVERKRNQWWLSVSHAYVQTVAEDRTGRIQSVMSRMWLIQRWSWGPGQSLGSDYVEISHHSTWTS